MLRLATPHRPLSVEEYLELEARSPIKHEYVGGELFAFAGASFRHNQIATTIARLLGNAALDSPCVVVQSDMQLRLDEVTYYYPDVMVLCDPTDRGPRFVRNPCLTVEVLSPSTTHSDLRDKLLNYRRIPDLQAYVVVFQDQPRVVCHRRDARDRWSTEETIGAGSVVIPCPPVELALADIYRGVDFTTPDPFQ